MRCTAGQQSVCGVSVGGKLVRVAVLAAVLAAVLGGGLPAAGQAQGTTPTSAPGAARAAATLTLAFAGGQARRPTSLVADVVRLRATVRPYVPGQRVLVKITEAGGATRTRSAPVRPAAAGGDGIASVTLTPRNIGRASFTAQHPRSAGQAFALAPAIALSVLPRALTQGSSGRGVRLMQRALSGLGYVTGQRGAYDARTARAVLAFRKQAALTRTASADLRFFRALRDGAGVFTVRYRGDGRHVEADLSHQTMALISDTGVVERIYPISSGKPSTPTVRGRYRIYRRDLGTNAKGMVDASYFYNGYAIHGFAPVPVYAASHGCLRTPVPDAHSIHDWLRQGTIVDVYVR